MTDFLTLKVPTDLYNDSPDALATMQVQYDPQNFPKDIVIKTRINGYCAKYPLKAIQGLNFSDQYFNDSRPEYIGCIKTSDNTIYAVPLIIHTVPDLYKYTWKSGKPMVTPKGKTIHAYDPKTSLFNIRQLHSIEDGITYCMSNGQKTAVNFYAFDEAGPIEIAKKSDLTKESYYLQFEEEKIVVGETIAALRGTTLVAGVGAIDTEGYWESYYTLEASYPLFIAKDAANVVSYIIILTQYGPYIHSDGRRAAILIPLGDHCIATNPCTLR